MKHVAGTRFLTHAGTGLCAVLAVALLWLPAGCGTAGEAHSPEELLRLGEQYLLELDYEQALVQFAKVVELEPMNPRGYAGAAEAHTRLGDVDSAIAVLERGFAVTGDIVLQGMLQRLGLAGELWDAFAALQSCFEAGDLDGAMDMIWDDLYQFLLDENAQVEPYLGEYTPGDRQEGIGMAAYPGGVYYGAWEDGVRSGYGIWLSGGGGRSYYKGNWARDMPNGDGELVYIYTDSRSETRATFQDGLYHGDVYITNYQEDVVQRWSRITAVHGVPQQITSPGPNHPPYSDGKYLVAVSDVWDGSLYSSGQPDGVEGLDYEWLD